MWHVYWNENNLNWKNLCRKRVEENSRKLKTLRKYLFFHKHTTTQGRKFTQLRSRNVNKVLLRAMKGKSHLQTLSEKFCSSLCRSAFGKLHNTKISNLKYDFRCSLEFIKYSGKLPLIFFVTSFLLLTIWKGICACKGMKSLSKNYYTQKTFAVEKRKKEIFFKKRRKRSENAEKCSF